MGQSQPNDIHANQKTHNHLSRRMIDMKTHEIKCWPKYFKLIWDGTKSFEVRKNDRDYKVLTVKCMINPKIYNIMILTVDIRNVIQRMNSTENY